MIKKVLHTFALISCFLGISSITSCTDGIYSPRGYIPEDGYDEDQTPPPEAQPPQSQKATPAFIQRILHENDMIIPVAPPPPKPAPKKPEPDLLDAS